MSVCQFCISKCLSSLSEIDWLSIFSFIKKIRRLSQKDAWFLQLVASLRMWLVWNTQHELYHLLYTCSAMWLVIVCKKKRRLDWPDSQLVACARLGLGGKRPPGGCNLSANIQPESVEKLRKKTWIIFYLCTICSYRYVVTYVRKLVLALSS